MGKYYNNIHRVLFLMIALINACGCNVTVLYVSNGWELRAYNFIFNKFFLASITIFITFFTCQL